MGPESAGCRREKGQVGGSAAFFVGLATPAARPGALTWVWLILGTLCPQSNLSNLSSLFLRLGPAPTQRSDALRPWGSGAGPARAPREFPD